MEETKYTITDEQVVLIQKYLDELEDGSEIKRLHAMMASLPLVSGKEEKKPSFEQITKEHLDWVTKDLPLTTNIGGLIHARKEIDEVISDIESGASIEALTEEYADVFFCELDSLAKSGITLEMLISAMVKKLEKNKGRTWKYNGDGSYSHVKPPVSDTRKEKES